MKRHRNLFPQIISMDNLLLAHRNARKGKGSYPEVQAVEKNPKEYLNKVQEMLKSKTFKTAPYKVRTILDTGKQREIYTLPYFPDRIVHHAIMNITQPIWDRTFIADCCSAIPGRGLHFGVKRLRKFLKDEENTQYCLKFDVRKYYPSINHNILISLIERKIKCRDTLDLLEDVVRSPGGDSNVPIGNYLSQYFANIYLNQFDHWVKEQQRMRYYIRYSDDGVILHKSKAHLQSLLTEIQEYLNRNLLLSLNHKTQIFPVDSRGIDFLGYRSFRTYTLLRKRTAKRFKVKVHHIEENPREPQHIISSIMSYIGWINHCDGQNLVDKYILQNPKMEEIMDSASEALGITNPLRNTKRNIGEKIGGKK